MIFKIVSAAVFGMTAAFATGLAQAQEIGLTAAQRKALGIESAVVSSSAQRPEASQFTGQVIIPPGGSFPVTSPFDAVLIETLAVPGFAVEAGRPIARLYSPDYEASQTELETRRLTAEHMAELAERAETLGALGLRSREEIEEAHHEATAAALEFTTSQRSLSIVRAGAGTGEFDLLARRSGEVAQILVQPGASVARAQPVVLLSSGNEFWLEIPVSETIAEHLDIGMTVGLVSSGRTGEIVATAPEIDPITRSVNVYVALPEGGRWRVGQLIDAQLTAASNQRGLSVPARAIVRFGDDTAVFVDRADGVELVNVNILSQNRSFAMVTGDLEPGDEVIVSGLAALKNIVEAG